VDGNVDGNSIKPKRPAPSHLKIPITRIRLISCSRRVALAVAPNTSSCVRSAWIPSTIYGNVSRGTGILNNELYVGRLVWNRLHYIKNPDTGRRVSRLNPQSEWITKAVPELRIISDDLWAETKRRQEATRRVLVASTSIVRVRRPRYLFSGLTKCGVCGSGFVLKSRNRLSCFGAQEKGICSNHLTIRREEVESRVLHALQEKLLRRDLVEEFCNEFTREINRLRMAARAGLTAMEQELARVEAQISKLIQALKDGVPASLVKDEIVALERQQNDLRNRLARGPSPRHCCTPMN